MKELKFYKIQNNTWWIDLPGYVAQGGDPAELQMVAGADDYLDTLAGEANEIKLQVAEQKTKGFDQLKRVDEIPTTSGRYYVDIESDTFMWLCDVTLWLFEGRFPETIWYKKI